MDTLIYFYQTNRKMEHPMAPLVQEYAQKDYRLLRIGLSAEAILLLEQNILCGEKNETLFEKILKKYSDRKKEKRAAERKKELLDRIGEFWGEEHNTYCICRPPVTYFDRWRFFEYRDAEWIERLLYGVRLPHFVVLGYADSLPSVLLAHARKMKSLHFYETTQDYCEELEEIADELFEEYGLTVVMHVLEEGGTYAGLKNTVSVPCNVLDFSGESRISVHMVPEGSVWFDIDCDEEKMRRMGSVGNGITYKSLTVPSKFSIIP